MSLQGQVIAITGAGQGIGLAAAKILASRGASVSLADTNPKALEDAEAEFRSNGWPVLTAVVDVRKRQEVEDWIDRTVQIFGKLNGAANVAGVVGKQIFKANVTEIDDADWELVMGVNVTGMSR